MFVVILAEIFINTISIKKKIDQNTSEIEEFEIYPGRQFNLRPHS